MVYLELRNKVHGSRVKVVRQQYCTTAAIQPHCLAKSLTYNYNTLIVQRKSLYAVKLDKERFLQKRLFRPMTQ